MAKYTDPVCGMQIWESEADGQSEYNGRTYYFCPPHVITGSKRTRTRIQTNKQDVEAKEFASRF